MKTVLVMSSIFSLCLSSVAAAQISGTTPKAAPAVVAPPQINVRDLFPGRVIGVLGKPLGTRTTINGVLAENVMLPNPVVVARIDGQAVKGPISIEVRGVVLQKGVPYQLDGYESGEFTGPPSWSAPGAQQPFQFRSFFVITKPK